MTNNRTTLWLGQWLALITAGVFITACSATAPPETSGMEAAPTAPTSNSRDSLFGETAVSASSETTPDTLPILPPDGAVDDSGVPVGFTENGNPYRGHLNAPVVLEEFSDFQ